MIIIPQTWVWEYVINRRRFADVAIWLSANHASEANHNYSWQQSDVKELNWNK